MVKLSDNSVGKLNEDWLRGFPLDGCALKCVEYDSTTETDTPSQNSDVVKPPLATTSILKLSENSHGLNTLILFDDSNRKEDSGLLDDSSL